MADEGQAGGALPAPRPRISFLKLWAPLIQLLAASFRGRRAGVVLSGGAGHWGISSWRRLSRRPGSRARFIA